MKLITLYMKVIHPTISLVSMLLHDLSPATLSFEIIQEVGFFPFPS
jgi:hypothetical protein